MRWADILSRAQGGERISAEEALYLYREAPLLKLAESANQLREKRHGNKSYFIRNKHIDYSNVCVLDCKFCAFARRPGQEGAFEYTIDQILHKIEEGLSLGIREVHIVGGFHPKHPWEFYTGLLQAMKKHFPDIHVKAFTAAEIHYFSKKFKREEKVILQELIAAGLDSMPGGGAEILSPEVRKIICGPKGPAELWLNTHRLAHSLGLKSTATMLYGHIESLEDRVEHMELIRKLQDETSGFLAFIPLAFNPKDTEFEPIGYTSGTDDLRTLATARLFFDNIRHIKAYWVMSGMEMAQIAQHFGADDLHGTVIEENITHMAGALSPQEYKAPEICELIWAAGRVPVERDSLYNEIQIFPTFSDSVSRV